MGFQGLKLALAPAAWTVLSSLVRLPVRPAGAAPSGPVIFACLHRDILPAIMYVRPERPALMVSSSGDGDILVRTLRRHGYRFVRGATGETGGGRALVGLRREIEAGHPVGLAVDGPKGPFGAIHEGVTRLARLTGAPVVPLRAVYRRALVLDTWDRTVVPVPGWGARIEEGPPLTVTGDTDPEAFRAALTDFFGGGGKVP